MFKRWADGTPFTLKELWLLWSLRRAGCRHRYPLFRRWFHYRTMTWRVRCGLCYRTGRAKYKPEKKGR